MNRNIDYIDSSILTKTESRIPPFSIAGVLEKKARKPLRNYLNRNGNKKYLIRCFQSQDCIIKHVHIL
jgi:hypothetical protein